MSYDNSWNIGSGSVKKLGKRGEKALQFRNDKLQYIMGSNANWSTLKILNLISCAMKFKCFAVAILQWAMKASLCISGGIPEGICIEYLEFVALGSTK